MNEKNHYYKRWAKKDPVVEKYYEDKEAEKDPKKREELKRAEEIREYLKKYKP